MVWAELRCDVVTAGLLPARAPSVSHRQQRLFLLSLTQFSAGPALPGVRSSAHWRGTFCSWFALLVSFCVAGLLPADGVL